MRTLIVAVLVALFAGNAFATKIHKNVRAGHNIVADYLATSEIDTIDFVFDQVNLPYSSASWNVCFDSTAAHGTFSARTYFFPSPTFISTDMSPSADTVITFTLNYDSLNQTSLADSIYWRKAASADSTAILTWVDESCYWTDDFRPVTSFVIRVIVSLSSGAGGYILSLNVMVQ